MKNHIVILRFGSPMMIRADRTAFGKLGVKDREAFFTPTTVGIVMVVNTDHTITECINAFKEAEAECHDQTPFVMFDIKDIEKHCHLDMFGMDKILSAYSEKTGFNLDALNIQDDDCEIEDGTLDELLDKVSKIGFENLSESEKIQLHNLTKK